MDCRWASGERTKHQIPNTNLQRNPKLQIPKPVAGSLPWSLGLGASLESGVWSLEFGVLIGGRISPLPTSPSWGEGIDRGLGGGIKTCPFAPRAGELALLESGSILISATVGAALCRL